MATREQCLAALERANEIRTKRAVLKASIADGRQTVGDVLLDVQDWSRDMPVFDLLAAQHRWGRSRSLALLSSVRIREAATVGELTPRQRNAVWERTT